MKKILFGAGKIGKYLINQGTIKDVAYFCDNNASCNEVNGIDVINFEKLLEIHNDYQIIVTVKKEKDRAEIRSMLESHGITYKNYDEIDEIKYAGEYGYWEMVFEREHKHFNNWHYKELMLSIAEEESDEFLKGKTVADFGCGPRGSLAWMKSPSTKIGIDVLAQYYFENFGEDMLGHDMIYVTSTEKYIPLPSESVDCLITINSLDHVRNIKDITEELLRILKKDGLLLCSFNLNEPKTECEPQTLSESLLNEVLLKYFRVTSYKIAKKNSEETYKDMREKKYVDKVEGDDAYILWVKGYKI